MKKRIIAIVLAMLCLLMNSCLAMSKESKADLDNELAQMVGDTGTKVPGLGVIAFKDGKEIYSSQDQERQQLWRHDSLLWFGHLPDGRQ